MNIFLTAIFYFCVGLVGIMPFKILYAISDFASYIMRDVIKYRLKVISDNVHRCFPDIKPEEEKKLISEFYRNLTDILLESVKSFTMSKKSINKRYKIENTNLLEYFHSQQKSIIAVAGHYCNWEWGSLAASLQTKLKIVGFYLPLNNPYIDRIIRNSRSKYGTTLASVRNTAKTFELYKDIPTAYLMIADQNPSRSMKVHWVDFMGIDSAFHYGPEKYAKLYNYPVLFIDIKRYKRGYYKVILNTLTDKPLELLDSEITKFYAQKLESVIRDEPANWLWSHRRWKMKR